MTEPSSKRKLSDRLPTWLVAGVKDGRSWKTFVRCMLTLFGCLILVLDGKSLRFLGQAAFFCLIVSVILPPSLPLGLFIMAIMTMVLGMLFGWAWGCAAMAAGLKARDQVLLRSQIQTAQQGYTSGANLDAQFQGSIFHGEFLDPRSSAVFGAFLFVGAYAMAWVRALKPRLILFSLFGTIIMDVQMSYGPLFPAAQYTLPQIILLPTAFYIAIAVTATILIFPQSLNHVVTTSLNRTVLEPITSQLKLQDEILHLTPSNQTDITEASEKARKTRKGIIAAVAELEGQMPLLQIEATRGHISGADLAKVFTKIKQLAGFSHVLPSFVILLDQDFVTRQHVREDMEKHRAVHMKKTLQSAEKHRKEGAELDDLFPLLQSSTSDLRNASQDALQGIIDWIHVVNHSRWSRPPKGSPEMAAREGLRENLRMKLEEFRSTRHFELLEPFRDLFDASGKLKSSSPEVIRWSTQALFRCHVFTTSLIGFSKCLLELMEMLLEIERANPKARLHFPSAFVKMLGKAAGGPEQDSNPLEMGSGGLGTSDDSSSERTLVPHRTEKTRRTYKKDADAGDPTNLFQRFGRGAFKLGKRLVSPQGLFALKYGLVSIAMWIPQVCHSSAFFVYSNRGLWALIMAQTGLGVFTGEQIASFVIRVAGTAGGLVLGMVIWYIGAPGNGTGNAYGIAAATMVLIAPVLFIRLLAPRASMALWMMVSVTAMLVVGYSWVDDHIIQVANAGDGASLAGRRALLVILGFAAAFIIMLFPRPLSAKRIVRKTMAKCIAETGELYATIIQAVEEDIEDDKDREDKDSKMDKIRSKFIKLLSHVQGIEQQIVFASFEPAARGPWPKERYQALYRAELGLLNALVLLTSTYERLKPEWTKRLERTNMMNPAFISDCLHQFALLQQSLESGAPLPVNVSILERLAYHWSRRLHVNGVSDPDVPFEQQEEVQAIAALGEPLTWDMCHDEQMAVFAAATVAMSYIASELEEVTREVVELVGQRDLSGLDRARERYV